MDWLGKQALGMPRPDAEMKSQPNNMVGKIEGKYEIYDAAKKYFK